RSAGSCSRAPRRCTHAGRRPARAWERAGSLPSGRAWYCWRRVRGGSCAPGTTAQVLLVRTAAVVLPVTAAMLPRVTTAAVPLAGTAGAPGRGAASGWRVRAGVPLGGWRICAGAADRRAGLLIAAVRGGYWRGARWLLARCAVVIGAVRGG